MGEKRISHTSSMILLVLVCLLVYANTLDNSFVWDDHQFALGWEEIRSFDALPLLLEGALPHGHSGVYRPLRSVAYMVSYTLWETNTWWYHLQSILLHTLCTLLVYLLFCRFVKKRAALLGALIFAVHPIHTENIAYIAASFDTLGVLFYLISLYTYICWRENNNTQLLSVAIVSGVIACFTYELCVTLPAVIILYEWLIKKNNLQHALQKTSPFIAITLVYFFIRFVMFGIIGRGNSLQPTLFTKLVLGFRLIGEYIQTLVVPYPLNVNHMLGEGITSFSLGIVPSNFSAANILSMQTIIAACLVLVLVWIFFQRRSTAPEVSFCIGWFFISLLPVLGLFSQAILFAEKYAYIASVSVALLIALAINTVSKKHITVATLAVLVTCAIFSGITLQRNNDWQDEHTLWKKTLIHTPNSPIALTNMGKYYLERKQFNQALFYFERAVQMNPEYHPARYGLGITYLENGQYQEALQELSRVLKSKGETLDVLQSIAITYAQMNDAQNANAYFTKILQKNPNKLNTLITYGNVLRIQGDLATAEDMLLRALAIDQGSAVVHYNLALTYKSMQKKDAAYAQFLKAKQYDPKLSRFEYFFLE